MAVKEKAKYLLKGLISKPADIKGKISELESLIIFAPKV
jgi:hypothetical protein